MLAESAQAAQSSVLALIWVYMVEVDRGPRKVQDQTQRSPGLAPCIRLVRGLTATLSENDRMSGMELLFLPNAHKGILYKVCDVDGTGTTASHQVWSMARAARLYQ